MFFLWVAVCLAKPALDAQLLHYENTSAYVDITFQTSQNLRGVVLHMPGFDSSHTLSHAEALKPYTVRFKMPANPPLGWYVQMQGYAEGGERVGKTWVLKKPPRVLQPALVKMLDGKPYLWKPQKKSP
jgi:hypothetical protein